MQTNEVAAIVKKIAVRIIEEKQFLTELDNAIGDGDHGINMARGFEAVLSKLDSEAYQTPSDVFKVVAMTLISTVGGSAGPLYGTAFLNMSKATAAKTEIYINDFIEAVKSGAEGVSMRGKSTEGEKTMLDSMFPAVRAMQNEANKGESHARIIEAGWTAAASGVEYTKTIAATKGRASYIGERSIGHQDPGATSFTIMLEEVKKAVKNGSFCNSIT